jgi:hypothetical protein
VLDRLYRFGPLSGNMIIEPPIHEVLENYSHRYGNNRWSGSSADCLVFARLLAIVWPRSQFICLTRHCGDVIACSIDASRWAMSGVGLDPVAMRYTDDIAATVGAFWLASAQAMVAFSESYSERSHHVRHEDLRADPEGTVARLFSFLGVPPTEVTAMPDQPADQAQVRLDAMPPTVTDSIDQALAALGYQQMSVHRTQYAL